MMLGVAATPALASIPQPRGIATFTHDCDSEHEAEALYRFTGLMLGARGEGYTWEATNNKVHLRYSAA